MLARTSTPLVLSVLIHAAVAGLMFWLMVRPAETPFVIEMPATRFDAQSTPGTQTDSPSMGNVVYTPVSLPQRLPPAVSDNNPRETPLRPERPVPTVPSVARPQNPPRLTPSAPPVAPTSGGTSPSSRPTTIAQHRRLHSSPSLAPTDARNSTVGAGSRINLDEVLLAGPDTGARTQSTSSDDRDAHAAYFGNLLSRLRAAHEKPEGLGEELQAQVEFVLRANGSLGEVRILKSSGNAAFDASVLAAFRRLRDLGVPPAGAAGTNTVTFRVQAE